MKSINFSTGVKEYAINDDENNKIRININDLNIPNRTKEVQDFFEAMAEKYKNEDVAHDKITLLCVGRMVPSIKGQDILIKSLKKSPNVAFKSMVQKSRVTFFDDDLSASALCFPPFPHPTSMETAIAAHNTTLNNFFFILFPPLYF